MAGDAPSPARKRLPLLSRTLLVAFAVVAGSLLVTPSPAMADPTDQSVSALQKQIDAEWDALEPTIENYDAVNEQLQSQEAKAAKLEKAIEPLALQVTLAQARIGAMSAQLYESGPTGGLAMLLNANSTANAIDLLTTVNQMAADRQDEIAATVQLKAKYEAQKAPIDALVTSLSAQKLALAAQKQTIDAQISALDKLRVKVWGQDYAPGATRPVACPQVYHGDPGSRAAAAACTQIGKHYVWDTAGPNTYDCSGLTMWAWAKVGVNLPHNAYAQKHTVPYVFTNRNLLKPGDLTFFYSNVHHVGIYVGNGWIVNAPNSGDVVRMAKLDHFPINSFGRPGT